MGTMTKALACLACSALLGCAYGPGGNGGADAGDDAAPRPVVDGGWPSDARTPGDAAAGGLDARAADAAVLAGRNGYPGDFPELTDRGGFGAGEVVIGFGGDDTTDRDGNRAQLQRRPVILLHGNGTTATHDNFGMTHMRTMLLDAGYAAAEVWAPSYLGQGVAVAETPTPTRSNIDDVRDFVDQVIDYLGVDRVDVIAHSLGCGLVHGYLRGLAADGSFDGANARVDRLGTIVCLGGAVYGTGYGFVYAPEFDVGGAFAAAQTRWNGVADATPYGADDTAAMDAPSTGQIPGGLPFAATSSVDDGSRRIHYVALWATGDIVDGNLAGGCGLQGADLNRGFVLPDSLPGVFTAQLARHGHLLRSQDVFDALRPFLNR